MPPEGPELIPGPQTGPDMDHELGPGLAPDMASGQIQIDYALSRASQLKKQFINLISIIDDSYLLWKIILRFFFNIFGNCFGLYLENIC